MSCKQSWFLFRGLHKLKAFKGSQDLFFCGLRKRTLRITEAIFYSSTYSTFSSQPRLRQLLTAPSTGLTFSIIDVILLCNLCYIDLSPGC